MQRFENTSIAQIDRELDRYKSQIESERKKLKKTTDELTRTSELLKKKNEELKQFNKSISHRFFDQKNILAALIDSSDDGIIIEDAQGYIIFINEQILNVLDVPGSSKDFIGQNCDELRDAFKVLFKDPEGFNDSIIKRLKELMPYSKERFTVNTGRIVERDFVPIYHEDEHLGNMWKYSDVTSQFEIEEALRKSEEKYRGIIEDMALGYIEIDNDETIINVFESFCSLTGYSSEELIGQNFIEQLIPDDQLSIMRPQHQLRLAGEPSTYEVRLNTKNGDGIWLLASGTPIVNDQDVVTGSIGMFFDLTDRKKLEDNLRMAQKIAEKSSRAEKEFLANMSHEIRNPINSVAGLTALLADTPLNDEQKDFVTNISHSSDVLVGIISGILDLSKIESGETQLDEELIYIHDIIEATIKSLSHKVSDKPIKISSRVHDDSTTPVIGDATVLNQILFNLMGNSLKFTESGEIMVSVDVIRETTHAIEFEFKISDTGIGMSDSELEIVFEKFKQANKETKLKYGGTGLGLAIVKRLIEQYEGEITATSEIGVGTEFSFNMKFRKADTSSIPKEEVSHKYTGSLENATMLIVEDNRINQIYLAGLMKKWQVNYDIAHNGRDALQYLQAKDYNVILMDIRMPEMDGYETTKWIRENSVLNKETPIIALTASAMVDEKQRAIDCGMNDHLPKPFSENQLLGVISKLDIVIEEKKPAQDVFEFSDFIDSKYILQLFHNDLDLIKTVTELFIEIVDEEMELLHAHIRNEDYDSFGKGIHKMKPNFLQVGFTEYRDDLESMQLKVDLEDVDTLPADFDAFCASFAPKLLLLKEEYQRLQSFLDKA